MRSVRIEKDAAERIVPQILLTIPEAAMAIGVSESKFYTMMRKGEIPVVELNGSTKIRPADLENLADANVVVRGQKN